MFDRFSVNRPFIGVTPRSNPRYFLDRRYLQDNVASLGCYEGTCQVRKKWVGSVQGLSADHWGRLPPVFINQQVKGHL